MKFDETRNSKAGFTLMEVLLVLALLGLIFSLTAFISLDNYRGSSFHNERDALVGVLQRARSQAMNNICLNALGGCTDSLPHGVHITANDYTIFQGSTYNSSDALNEITKIDAPIQISADSFTDVIFTQLSGDASTIPTGAATLTMSDATGHNSAISINNFGQITWTN